MERYQLRVLDPGELSVVRQALDAALLKVDRSGFQLVPLEKGNPILATAATRAAFDRLQTALLVQGIDTFIADSTQFRQRKPNEPPRKLTTISEEALQRDLGEKTILSEWRQYLWPIVLGIGALVAVIVSLVTFASDFTAPVFTAADFNQSRKVNIEAHLDGVNLTAHEPAPSGAGGGNPAAFTDDTKLGNTSIHVEMGGPAASGPTSGAGAGPQAAQAAATASRKASPGKQHVSAGTADVTADVKMGDGMPGMKGGDGVRAAALPSAKTNDDRLGGVNTEMNVKIDSSGKPNTITIEPSDDTAQAAPPPAPPPPLPPPEPPKPDRRGLGTAFILGLILALAIRWVWLTWRPVPAGARRPGWAQRGSAASIMAGVAAAASWVVITQPPDAVVKTLAPAGPLNLVASMSGEGKNETISMPAAGANETEPAESVDAGSQHSRDAFSRFFKRMRSKPPAAKNGRGRFHGLMKSMHMKLATDQIRSSAQTDWQKELPPPGSRLSIPTEGPARKRLEADVQAIWHAGAPADSHEHECVPSALARARSSLLERANWSYLVRETEVTEGAGDGGSATAPDPAGMSLNANIDVPAEALAAGMDQARDTPAAARPPVPHGPRQAQTIAMPLGQQQPPEVAGLQGAPDKPDRPVKPRKRLPPLPPKQSVPPSAQDRLCALLAGLAIGGLGSLLLRPRLETA